MLYISMTYERPYCWINPSSYDKWGSCELFLYGPHYRVFKPFLDMTVVDVNFAHTLVNERSELTRPLPRFAASEVGALPACASKAKAKQAGPSLAYARPVQEVVYVLRSMFPASLENLSSHWLTL